MKKRCRECKKSKNEEHFARNQFGKNNRVLRRPVCKECYGKKIKIKPRERKKFERKNPKPSIGDCFECPICQQCFERQHRNDVVLDHNDITGEIRGWLCNSCNTSLGKFKDSVIILKRAIRWIKGTL